MSHTRGSSRERESRHLWVGGLPDDIGEAGIKEYFTKYGKIEGVKILPQKYPNIGVAAFIDFYEVRSATEAKEAKHKLGGQELRTNFKNNPGERHEGGTPHDKDRHTEKDSGSSSSGSDSESSSSSSSSDSEQESRRKAKKSGAGPFFIKVTGLASRSERVLQDGLYYEFCRYSNNVVVRLYSDAEKKWAMIKYKRADKCKEALSQSQGLMLFGSKIKLTQMDLEEFPPGGHDQKRPPPPLPPPHGGRGGPDPASYQYMLEDLDPLATRSLFVGNIPKHISVYELRDAFLRYGNVLDVEIKKMGGNATYGFILYYDLMSAVNAKQYMDGHNLKGNNIRVGFGKGTPSKQLWIDGIDPAVSESYLERQLVKYGKILRLGVDRPRACAMVQYDTMDAAKEALTAVKGTYIKNSRKLMTDFANRDARAAFFSRVEGMEVGSMPPPPRGFPGPPGPMYGSDMMGDPRFMPPPPHMMGRGGGFPPHGHPMDYYYNPYMDDFYGGRPPYGPPGMHRFPPPSRPFGREGPDEYDEELRAFSRKREREKRKRQETSSSAESDSENEEEEEEGKVKRKSSRGKDKGRKAGRKAKRDVSDEGETDDSESEHEGPRMVATRKSRDLREKLKKLSQKKEKAKKEVSSDEKSSSEEENHKLDKSKGKVERKTVKEQENDTPAKPVQKKARKASPSPEAPARKSRKATPSPEISRKKPRKASPSPDVSPPPPQEEVCKHKSSKPAQEVVGSPPRSNKRQIQRSPRSPGLRSPQTPPASSVSSKQRRESSDGVEVSSESKSRGREQQKRKERERPKKEDKEVHKSPTVSSKSSGTTSKPKAEHPSNSAAAVPAQVPVQRDKEREEPMDTDTLQDLKDPRVRKDITSKSKEKLATPQSPAKSSRSSTHGNIESDLSSGEEYRERDTSWKNRRGSGQKQSDWSGKDRSGSRRERSNDADYEGAAERRGGPSSPAYSTPRPTTPLEEPEWKDARTPPLSEEEEEYNRRSRKLPRRYQIEVSASEPGLGGGGGGRREPGRESSGRHPREIKDPRRERRHHPQPPSPSPPPQSFSGHARKRHYHSPPPPSDGFDRRRHRGRPHSPPGGVGGGYQQRRRHSRSPPPHFGSPPSHRAKSPYGGGSPPHSRPRSPIARSRASRRRYESPPFEGQRGGGGGKYARGHGSPQSPHHRYPFSPTPPPPVRGGGGRSPPGRRFGRRRSSSLTPPPPRGGRMKRRESSDYGRMSPRAAEDRYEPGKRHLKQRAYSRTPSPTKDKYRDRDRDMVKEEYSEPKRRRPVAARPKSPSGTPPPSREETKTEVPPKSSRQAHLPDTTSDQRGFKSSGSGAQQVSSSHRQPPADTSTKTPSSSSSHSQAPPAKSRPAAPPENNLMDLLRRYPVMWQGLLTLKNDSAAVQLHFLSGNGSLAKTSLPQQTDQPMPVLRISQRMRLEKTQLEGVDRRIQTEGEHCLLLALPCGRDATDVHTQTHALKNNLINYLLQKQAAGIINVPANQGGYVLHIFPPCPFSQSHLSRVAPDLLSNASVNCHLMIVVATM